MRKIIIMMFLILTMISGVCFAENCDNYNDVLVELDGNSYILEDTNKELFKEKLKGIKKVTIISMKTEGEPVKNSFFEALSDGNYYIIIKEPQWFGENDKDMETVCYIVKLN